jgi:Flp pilus assembly protein TadD/peroxiredoxin
MSSHRQQLPRLSRRDFVREMSLACGLFLPAPFSLRSVWRMPPRSFFPDFQVTPHYPANSPLHDFFEFIEPGSDEFISEKYALEITALLERWAEALKISLPALDVLRTLLDDSIEAGPFSPADETSLQSHYGIDVVRRNFPGATIAGRSRVLDQIKNYFGSISKIETVEFEITSIGEIANSPLEISADIRYELAGKNADGAREQRIGYWQTQWVERQPNSWYLRKWRNTQETLSRARERLFEDITSQAIGQLPSYKDQLLHGVDYWRTMLDGASGIDVYGNNGVAIGDYDNDGFDDIYICQPAGLPNRLYRNRGDGTFEDATDSAGLAVLDSTSCALFADFENKGLEDLLVVTGGGPLLFLNQGKGKFSLKRDAFKFGRIPEGAFTHAALSDYDCDGRLDVYFCIYNYYAGLDQYHYPSPYFDARNGPPNFLFHNQGDGKFVDQTEAAGLNVENDRYSFACAWGDYNLDGWPDLYVANDFGRSNLYRNNGDGTFRSVSTEAMVDDVGAGMSASWTDFENDGAQDIYVANMWSAAGMRISDQEFFQKGEAENIRELYRRHARGNSLYKNRGAGKFSNIAPQAGVEMGRWSWSSDTWDFDHDGYPDLYITNGYISGSKALDLASFFWRQVVGKSPASFGPSLKYERGWNAINELIRSDFTWNGFERNVLYRNNGDGTFADISAVAGLDFPEDSRAFALIDLDHDGRLEIVLKNRNAPQVRILRNTMSKVGNAIAFRLRGMKSNRDAIGAAITVEADGHRQTKYLQAGSGFLSQHTKELLFGLRDAQEVSATVRWPSGATQNFGRLPANHRIEVVEGSGEYQPLAFRTARPTYRDGESPAKFDALPSARDTWLLEPLSAPEFSLVDISGKTWTLSSLRGSAVLLVFWAARSDASREQLRMFRRYQSKLLRLKILALNVDSVREDSTLRSFLMNEGLSFPVLPADDHVIGVYNIVFRYLFDRHRDLNTPTSLLIDQNGSIVKVYEGVINPESLIQDFDAVEDDLSIRSQKALPFRGTLHLGAFERNDFTYGVAFFQHGFLNEAAQSFKQVIANKPDEPEAYYNLGTLYLRQHQPDEARAYLEQAIRLKPSHAEAWNNLGMLAAEAGNLDAAEESFKKSLALRPSYTVALINLANLFRRQKSFSQAEELLNRALQLEPDNPEANYSLGMLYAQQDEVSRGEKYLEKAVALRPGYQDALNNLGVLLVREQRYSEAEAKFQSCIEQNPAYDQAYMNLARLYVIENDKAKAKAVLQSLLKQQPQHKMAQQALEMLE